jgi:hypothetical protein
LFDYRTVGKRQVLRSAVCGGNYKTNFAHYWMVSQLPQVLVFSNGPRKHNETGSALG